MEGVNTKLEPLIGNENGLSIQQIQEWLQNGEITVDDLRRVLDEDTVQDAVDFVEGRIETVELPHSDVELNEESDRTEVYFWGLSGVGKSSVIGSIVAAERGCIDGLNGVSDNGRGISLTRAFDEINDTVCFPHDATYSTDGTCDIINADFKDKLGRKHPLALVEVRSGEDGFEMPRKLLRSTRCDKIHIFCYDCTRKDNMQDIAIMDCIDKLEKRGVLSYSVGLYLLVTKTDSLFGVPEQYRTQAAQTLVTARHKSLWLTVKNTCYRLNIYDARPLPFSVGKVRLGGLVTVDHTYARMVIDDLLVQKSHAARTWIGRMLSKGNVWTTATAIALVMIVAGYMAYGSFDKISTIPGDKLHAFSYTKYYEEETTKLRGSTYFKERANIAKLEEELATERAIKLKSGKHLLKASEIAKCEGVLYDEEAKLLCSGFRYEFKGKWNENVLNTLLDASHEVLRCRYLSGSNSGELTMLRNTAKDYFRAKELIANSQHCTSEEDVEWVENNVSNYQHEPLTNCDMIREGLENAVSNAHRSYQRYKTNEKKPGSIFDIDWRSIFR